MIEDTKRCGRAAILAWALGVVAGLDQGALSQASTYGEWDPQGPFELMDQLKQVPAPYNDEESYPQYDEGVDTGEIVHAAVLPPYDIESPVARVLFVCVPGYELHACDTSPCRVQTAQLFGRSYVWKPARNLRASATPVELPSHFPPVEGSSFGSQDFFCAGQAFLGDGRLMFAGGSDYQIFCEQCSDPGDPDFAGHDKTWILDPATNPPEWYDYPVPMSQARWYPSIVALANGDAFVFGHELLPNGDQQIIRDEYSLVDGSFVSGGRENLKWVSADSSCTEQQQVVIGDYPRLHLLRNGQLMQSIVAAAGQQGHSAVSAPSRFLDITEQLWSQCGDPVGDPDLRRWRSGGSGATPADLRTAGSSVHLIAWNGSIGTSQSPSDFTEVIYLVGGAKQKATGDDCSASSSGDILSTAEKMVEPRAPGTTSGSDAGGSWTAIDSMTNARFNHNTVILADGSLLAVGGVYDSGASTCTEMIAPERYEPTEIFGGSSPVWVVMANQVDKRSYHSVACLLPDGSVASAGGLVQFDSTMDSEQSVEVYEPPYCFPDSDRPDVDADDLDPEVEKDYGEQLLFDVMVKDASTTVSTVALIRPSAVTHGCDMSQRYVQLKLSATPTAPTARKRGVSALMPIDGFHAPPGYYMLVVVDSNKKPSHSVWIKLAAPP